MNCADRYLEIRSNIPESVTLLAVSKTWPKEDIMLVYDAGCRDFGENKVQEMADKHGCLPQDIRWHQIGHLQTNKVKYIAGWVYMIHSVDSLKLAAEISKQAAKHSRIVNCLLQVKVAEEDTKSGFNPDELKQLLASGAFSEFSNIKLCGLMAMATNTSQMDEVRREFLQVKSLFDYIKANCASAVGEEFCQISMGMSGDCTEAIECGSTLVRIGSTIFGERDYSQAQHK